MPRAMIANGRVSLSVIGVSYVHASKIRRIAIVTRGGRHVFRIKGVFFRPYRYLRVRVVNEFIRGRIVEVSMRYLH